ncbi:MAG: hypothetical protein ACI841_001852 [Planctomycetota bacterium]|jgi:hypothetical protein
MIDEMRVSDDSDPIPSPLLVMGYPSNEEDFRFPKLLVETFLDREILEGVICPSDVSEYVMNSPDEILIEGMQVRLRGWGWKINRGSSKA